MREAIFSVDSQRQSWGEFVHVLRRPRVQIGLLACTAAGIGAGVLVAFVDLDAQVVYSIGLAAVVAVGAFAAYLRTQTAQWAHLYAAIESQSRAISEVERHVAESRQSRDRLETAHAILRQHVDLATEHRQRVEATQAPSTEIGEGSTEKAAVQQFRAEILGLLKKYEGFDLPESEQDVWPIILGLSLYEAGLYEISNVGQADDS